MSAIGGSSAMGNYKSVILYRGINYINQYKSRLW